MYTYNASSNAMLVGDELKATTKTASPALVGILQKPAGQSAVHSKHGRWGVSLLFFWHRPVFGGDVTTSHGCHLCAYDLMT